MSARLSEIAVMSLSRDIWGRGRQSEKHAWGIFPVTLLKELIYDVRLN